MSSRPLDLASISPAYYPHVQDGITHSCAPCGDPGENISALTWPGYDQDGIGAGRLCSAPCDGVLIFVLI